MTQCSLTVIWVSGSAREIDEETLAKQGKDELERGLMEREAWATAVGRGGSNIALKSDSEGISIG